MKLQGISRQGVLLHPWGLFSSSCSFPFVPVIVQIPFFSPSSPPSFPFCLRIVKGVFYPGSLIPPFLNKAYQEKHLHYDCFTKVRFLRHFNLVCDWSETASRWFIDWHTDPPGLSSVGKLLCSLSLCSSRRGQISDRHCDLYPVRTRPFVIRENHPLGVLSELLLTELN